MPNNVGENIKKRRKELNYSQKKLLNTLGYHSKLIQNMKII